MRTLYLLLVLAVLTACKAEDASISTITGIAVPANMSGIPSN